MKVKVKFQRLHYVMKVRTTYSCGTLENTPKILWLLLEVRNVLPFTQYMQKIINIVHIVELTEKVEL